MDKLEYLEALREDVRTEARAEALREMILSLGEKRFGKPPSRKHRAQVEAITDPARLERIADRLLDAPSWTDLLATP